MDRRFPPIKPQISGSSSPALNHRRISAFIDGWRLSAFIGGLFLCLGLVSCGGDTSSRQITIAVNAGVEGDALKAASRDYEAKTGVAVQIVELPYANLFEKELLDLSNRTGAYDVIMLDDPWFPRFTHEDFLTPLEPLLQARGMSGPDPDFIAACLAVCRNPYPSGALYALPYVGNSQLFFYRQDLFEKYRLRPPQTWDDVLKAARTISEGEKNIHGYVMRAAQGNAAVTDFMPLFWAFGAEMFDDSGRPSVNSAEGIAALKMMLELGRYTPPGYASFNADEVNAHLLQSTAAMSINWPAWIPAVDNPAKSKVVGKIAFCAIPGQKRPGAAEIGNWLLAIPRGSRHADPAFDFIFWATSKEQMRLSALRGNPPTRAGIFQDPELTKKYRAYPVQFESLRSSRPRPRTHLWNEIENTFGIYLSKANSGELSAEEAMRRANAELERILARNR